MNLTNILEKVTLRKLLAAGVATFVGYKVFDEKIGPSSRLPTVSVIDLHGTILADGGRGGLGSQNINLDSMKKKIDLAFYPKSLKAVLLNINSPGGSPVQSDLVGSYIKEKAAEKDVPVIVFVEDMAASGGYWLACTGSEIYAARCSVVGSIGVISQGLGFHQLIEKLGIDNRTYTAGENKSINNPFDPPKESDIKIVKELLNTIHQVFIEHVKTSRGDRLVDDDHTLFNGQYWTADAALKLGLIDGIEHMETYINRTWGKEGKDVRVFRLKNKMGLAGLLSGVSSYLSPESLLTSSSLSPPVTQDSEVQSLISSFR